MHGMGNMNGVVDINGLWVWVGGEGGGYWSGWGYDMFFETESRLKGLGLEMVDTKTFTNYERSNVYDV